MIKICDNCYIIGKVNLYTISAQEQQVILASGFSVPTSQVHHFKRMMINSVIYCSERYTRSCDNSICCYNLKG